MEASATSHGAAWSDLQSVFLTTEGTPRALKATKAMTERLGAAGVERYLQLHAQLGERVIETVGRLEDQQAIRLTRWGVTAGLGLLERYRQLKEERDALDFTDAETGAWRLLADDVLGPALLMKLDTRWRHLLLDEFQDTNPVQWQILRAWLDAYGADGSRPTLFVVGDPKQSIYRFRRAEPRLFDEVRYWLARDWQALYLPNNLTRRLSPRVAAWVNGVFEGQPDYPVFHAHSVHDLGLPGRCEVIEAESPADAEVDAQETTRLRDPLSEPLAEAPEKRAGEARRVAERIRAMVGRLAVREAGGERPARYRDIMLLSATRTGLEAFETAFKAAGIPFVTSRRGGLLDTLEAADLIALFTWLITPADDLALAQVLKSPLCNGTDADLQALVGQPGRTWAARLAGWVASGVAPASMARAWGLLQGWRQLAGRVPTHDLLDRIFHEGEVEARYAASVPQHLLAGVRANLHALLAHSLAQSGGRYPSLPRFLDELKSLRDRAGQDAPDEAPADSGDCVRLMTIHAAKGLEAPVVFLIKADETDRDQDHYGVLLKWPAGETLPEHFSLFGPKGWRGRARTPLFDDEGALRQRERLNLLYVAMTRARQVLVVSGLGGASPESWLGRVRQGLERARLAGLPEAGERADWPAAAASGVAPQPGCPPLPPVGAFREQGGPEAELGVRVHRYLELVTAGWGEAEVRRLLSLDEAVFSQVRDVAGALLRPEGVARFFDLARYHAAHNELEFVDADGSVRRIDRLVECEDGIWVLDYKTGGLDEPDLARRTEPYLAQMRAYLAAMARLYPGRPVRGMLLYADGRHHEIPE